MHLAGGERGGGIPLFPLFLLLAPRGSSQRRLSPPPIRRPTAAMASPRCSLLRGAKLPARIWRKKKIPGVKSSVLAVERAMWGDVERRSRTFRSYGPGVGGNGGEMMVCCPEQQMQGAGGGSGAP